MNKKGFTLVEMITTLTIMILIGLVIVNNMANLFSKEEEANYEDFVFKVAEAGCVYFDVVYDTSRKSSCKSGGGCMIRVDDLIKEGYLSEDLINPKTGEVIDKSKSVSVSWVSNEKKCTFSD